MVGDFAGVAVATAAAAAVALRPTMARQLNWGLAYVEFCDEAPPVVAVPCVE